ncbi:MAG: hypothetical protein MI757_20075 [Pirellulales bacterium]|nr:hypothetical protein [Pirellulales bacterium]
MVKSSNTCDAPLMLPEGLPDWITQDLVRQTLDVWQPRYGRELTTDEAIEILRNVVRLAEFL